MVMFSHCLPDVTAANVSKVSRAMEIKKNFLIARFMSHLKFGSAVRVLPLQRISTYFIA
jgi:hypothetical protein